MAVANRAASGHTVSVRTDDVDQARAVVAEYFYAHFLDVLRPSPPFAAVFDAVSTDDLTVADLTYGADVRMRLGELGAYHVDLLLCGQLVWRQGRDHDVVATPDRAAVFQPMGDTVLEHWTADCRLVAVKIGRPALEAELEQLIEAPVRGPVQFSRTLDISTGAGRSWASLVRLLADETKNPTGLLTHPLLGPRLREDIMRALLLAAEHPYRDRLATPQRGIVAPKAIRRVVDTIQVGPEQPHTLGTMAKVAGISTRSLQDGFRRHLGVSPVGYLRDVRLARAHDELCRAAPGTRVSDVAYRWGFVHLGRFAAQYQVRYGVIPSATLRQGGR